jgi:hypothetical protein
MRFTPIRGVNFQKRFWLRDLYGIGISVLLVNDIFLNGF